MSYRLLSIRKKYMRLTTNTAIFSLYGTIIKAKPGLRPAPEQSIIETFRYYGCEENKIDKIIQKHKSYNKNMENIMDLLQVDNKKVIYDKYNETLDEILQCNDYCILHDNYTDIINNMYSNGLKYLCCTTDMTYTQVAIIMNRYNELRFSKIITANNRLKPQPAPDSIYHIMDKLNIYDYNIVRIGNTVDDIKEGNNAKVINIGVSNDNEIRNELTENGADYTINNLYCLPNAINEINKKIRYNIINL